MQSSSWAPEHSKALREQIVRGVSYGEAVDVINAQFGTAYTRSAAIGRGKRMGLAAPAREDDRPMRVPKAPQRALKQAVRHRAEASSLPVPAPEHREPAKLRCVGIRPRLVSLVELEAGDCRYPYGGDREGEAIFFCGHPRFGDSSYCAPHFHLTRAPASEAERPAGPFVLRLVRAA
jgi:GcrA cell cycle regulator